MYIKLLQMIYVHKDIHIYRINTFTKLYLYTHTHTREVRKYKLTRRALLKPHQTQWLGNKSPHCEVSQDIRNNKINKKLLKSQMFR